MKILERLILAAGVATLAFLFWRFDAGQVWALVSRVGLGFLVIFPFQILDHMLNAWGWRFAFSAKDARDVPFWRLVLVRVAGDGVNYLTPSATIAGELVRPAMLGEVATGDVRNTSVVVAKLTQALGQAVFILLGIVFVLQGRLDLLAGRQKAFGIGMSLATVAFLAVAVYVISSRPGAGDKPWQAGGKLGAVRGLMRRYLKEHPGRFALSILFFMAGYAWGALEVLLICRFMGVAMPFATAFAVEVLSNIIDSLMFMVPGKLGTQEAGKTAIFAALGFKPQQGLAFGLVRHARELLWASAGFLIYVLHRRRPAPRAPAPSSPLLPAEPLARAD